ncbi:unnamed protein product [Didymodactylos carnosus]|uniref:Uncharacterized protein n=1 Tax=Didymodactylos carnosus TaxID=1234261 RepID=A0A814PUK5_9BILA|nr:unnamed protein product [Didymodactylos carnosus]CAF3875474.1 unnamed protein product [Didymodactylos carnosus]
MWATLSGDQNRKLGYFQRIHLYDEYKPFPLEFFNMINQTFLNLTELHIAPLGPTSEEQRLVREQSKTLYLLTENNQWKLGSALFVYMESDSENSSFNHTIPCLKLDFANKNHPKLNQLLELMNVKHLRMNDLSLVDKEPLHAEGFRMKLIQIPPYIKKWLNEIKFQSDAIH